MNNFKFTSFVYNHQIFAGRSASLPFNGMINYSNTRTMKGCLCTRICPSMLTYKLELKNYGSCMPDCMHDFAHTRLNNNIYNYINNEKGDGVRGGGGSSSLPFLNVYNYNCES